MNSLKDPSSFSIYPKLREDLIIVPQIVGGVQTYLIKDPVNRAYHRVGAGEYCIVKLLDGQHSFNQIIEKVEETEGLIVEPKNLEDLLKFFENVDLLEKPKALKSTLFYQKMKDKRKKKLKGRLGGINIMEVTIPAFDPNKFFDRIIHPLRFLWSKGFFIFTIFCFFSVILIASHNWDAFRRTTFGIYSLSGKTVFDFVTIYVLYFLVVVIHEFAHGLTCKFYGGEVHETGLVLYYFNPCFYCRVDDAYTFKNKYNRIMVMVAGAYSELILCSFAVFVWWLTPPHTFLHYLSAYTMALTSFLAVILNFNPLMEYDGYYILSDYLEVFNLRQESSSYIRAWVKKNILRMPVETQDLSPRLRKIYVVYGVSALMYTGFVLVVLILIAKSFLVSHYHIWGILILLAIIYLSLRKGVRRLWNALKEAKVNRRFFPYLKKHPIPFLLGFLIVFYVFFFVKMDWLLTKDFTLEAKEKIEVRSARSGYIRKVLVEEGNDVVQNQILVVVENDSLENHMVGLRYELSTISQKIRGCYLGNDLVLLEACVNEKQRLETELKEAQRKIEELEIRAPTNGRLLTPKMEHKLGIFVETGDVICELAGLSEMRAKIQLSQWEIGDVKENDRVELLVSRHTKFLRGRIKRLSLIPEDPSLFSYEAYVQIEGSEKSLKPGLTGTAKIFCGEISLGTYFWRKILRSFRAELWK